jgi:hypothetical protein
VIVKLNTEQCAALQRWIDEAKPIVRLGHWYIVAKDNPPENGDGQVDTDAFAGSYIRDNSDHASVHLGDSFWEESPEEQRETLTHELLHCHLYRLHAFIGDRLNKADRATASSMEEIAIEQLSRIIAPLLPLPEIPRQ